MDVVVNERRKSTIINLKITPILIRLIIAILLTTFSFTIYASQTIQFYTHSSGTETYTKNGQLRGLEHSGRRAYYVEFIREVMKLMEVPLSIQNVPLPRGLSYVQNQPNIAYFNVSRIPDRENKVIWVAPLLQSKVFFFESAKFPTSIRSIEDAKQVRLIAVVRNSVHDKSLKRIGFTNLYPVTSYMQARDMLLKGRIDLIVYADFYSRDYEIDKSWHGVINTGVKAYESTGYLVFSKDIPARTVEKWRKAMHEVKSSEHHQLLLKKYLYPKPNTN